MQLQAAMTLDKPLWENAGGEFEAQEMCLLVVQQ